MSSFDEPNDKERARTRKAVQIIRRLDEDPEDQTALLDRNAFLSRGALERATYDRTLRAMEGAETRLRRDRSKHYAFGLLAAMLASLALAWQPLRLHFTADFQSGHGVEAVQLASGDVVVLDASSAISDETEDGIRGVNLLSGAGFFDVDTRQTSFMVQAGDVTVETLGTAFEVSLQGPSLQVSVAEGAVRVTNPEGSVELAAGERLRLNASTLSQSETVEGSTVATWRNDVLVANGMTVGEIAAIIDRRITGSVLVLTDDLQSTVVHGRIDLSRPEDALRTLAASVDGQVTIAPLLGAVLRP